MSFAELFRPMVYDFEKLSEGIRYPRRRLLGLPRLERIADRQERFVSALEENGKISALDQARQEEARHVVMRLQTHFEVGSTPDFNEADARIYVWFLREYSESLQEMARSLDDGYAASQSN